MFKIKTTQMISGFIISNKTNGNFRTFKEINNLQKDLELAWIL